VGAVVEFLELMLEIVARMMLGFLSLVAHIVAHIGAENADIIADTVLHPEPVTTEKQSATVMPAGEAND
jgi:hypothetical protein